MVFSSLTFVCLFLPVVAVLYLVMSVPLILFVGWLERRMQQAKR